MAFLGLSCVLLSNDIKKIAEFYAKIGFSAVEYLHCNEPHICLYCGNAEIILTQARNNKFASNHTLYGYGYDAYIYVNNQIELQKKCKSADIRIIKLLAMTDYNNDEFVIEDIDGRWVAFGLKQK